jgi:hypothetical protein
MEKQEILKSRKSDPDTDSWYEYLWRAEQETPNRLEDAAKFLATMISVSLTLFLAVGKNSFEKHLDSPVIKMAVVFWILSLVSSFWVMFPYRYRYVSHSVQSIKEMNSRIVKTKYRLLVLSLSLFFIGLGILGYFFFLP